MPDGKLPPRGGGVPPSKPTPLHNLGIELGSGGGQGPMRTQLIIALVAGIILIAVPLYLWKNPKDETDTKPDAAPDAVVDTTPQDPKKALIAAALDGGVKTDKVHLGKVWTDRCERPGPGRTPPEQCDRLPFFEEALVKGVLENTACAPRRKKGGTVSVALKIDFRREQLRVFAGKSGSIGRSGSSELLRCVRRSLPTPDWNSLPHDHTKYIIAVLATFPPADDSS